MISKPISNSFPSIKDSISTSLSKVNNFTSLVVSTRKEDKRERYTIGNYSFDSFSKTSGYLGNIEKLGNGYPSSDNYYYILAVDDSEKLEGKYLRSEVSNEPPSKNIDVPLTRY